MIVTIIRLAEVTVISEVPGNTKVQWHKQKFVIGGGVFSLRVPKARLEEFEGMIPE